MLAQLRVRDDAGHQPRLVADAAGSPLRCCLRRIRLEFGCFQFEVTRG